METICSYLVKPVGRNANHFEEKIAIFIVLFIRGEEGGRGSDGGRNE